MYSKRSSTLVECLQKAVTPQLASSLQHNGFAVADRVFGDENCQRLLQEAQALRDTGQMHANCTHLVRGGERKLLEKADISEADLLQKSTQEATVHFSELQADTSLRTMLSLYLPKLRLDSQAIKVQFNAGGGGCFPIHFDSDEAVDARRVTAIVYLNRQWRGSDGGQLRLYPDLSSHTDIEPINDRLLLFSSCRMPHRVLPSAAERYCFTIWLSQTRLAGKAPTPLAKVVQMARGRGHLPSEALLGEPELRKCLAKLAYADEWIQSLEESHAASAARTHVIDSFRDEINFLQEQLGPVFPDDVANEWKRVSALCSRHSAAWF